MLVLFLYNFGQTSKRLTPQKERIASFCEQEKNSRNVLTVLDVVTLQKLNNQITRLFTYTDYREQGSAVPTLQLKNYIADHIDSLDHRHYSK